MGTLLLVGRLAVKDIRYRPAQAILLLLAITASAATLTLGLALHGTTNDPYARTRAATNGPDVVATVLTGGSSPGPATSAKPGTGASTQPQAAALRPLLHTAGVAAHSGPFPITWTLLRDGRTPGSAEVEARGLKPASVDRPKLLHGTWLRPGGVVVEAGYASALGIDVGDRLSLGGSAFRVVGTAVTAAVPAFPNVCSKAEGCFLANAVAAHNPGLVWATQSDARRVAGTAGPDAYFLNLKLTNPAAAKAFADRYNANNSASDPYLLSWQHIRDGDAQTLLKVRTVLMTGSVLLALLAIASVAVLVGGRMVEQTRRVGLLKAVGGTPWLVAVMLLVEHVLVGVCAAALGLLIGWLVAPLIDGPGAGLLGAASAPSLSAGTVAAVVALAVGVAILATFVPAIHAARQSTVTALNDSARKPQRRDVIIRLSGHLPAPLLFGVRLTARRPRRLLLGVFSIAITTSGLVLVLIFRATAGDFLGARVGQATTIISVMLVVLAAVNAVVIAWTTALEIRHSAALARALGATPRQITAGLAVAQLLPALFGALLGIAGGIGFYYAAKSGPGATALPSPLSLAALVAVTLLAAGVLTAVPTRIGAGHAVADVLQAELA